MPVLEDGLSSGHASDTDNNNPSIMVMKRPLTESNQSLNRTVPGLSKSLENGLSSGINDCSGRFAVDANKSAYDDILSQVDSLGSYLLNLEIIYIIPGNYCSRKDTSPSCASTT